MQVFRVVGVPKDKLAHGSVDAAARLLGTQIWGFLHYITYTRLNKENRNEIHTWKLSDYYVDEDVDVVGVEQLVAVFVKEHVHNHLRDKQIWKFSFHATQYI